MGVDHATQTAAILVNECFLYKIFFRQKYGLTENAFEARIASLKFHWPTEKAETRLINRIHLYKFTLI